MENLRVALIVEDEAIRTLLTRAAVESGKYVVITPDEGPEGSIDEIFETADRGCGPDVVLIEMHMAGMNGVQITRILRQDPATRAMFIALVAEYANDLDRGAAELAGADCFGACVPDMFEMEKILACIAVAAANVLVARQVESS